MNTKCGKGGNHDLKHIATACNHVGNSKHSTTDGHNELGVFTNNGWNGWHGVLPFRNGYASVGPRDSPTPRRTKRPRDGQGCTGGFA